MRLSFHPSRRQHWPGTGHSTRVSTSRRRLLMGGALAGVGGLFGIAGIQRGLTQEASPPAGATPGATPAATPGATPASAGAATEFTIVMGRPAELGFDPNVLSIPANTDVTITLPNEGQMIHDFHIRELAVATEDLQPGESTTVTINAPEPGEFEFYCDVDEHRDLGMVGTLIVE